VGVICQLLHRLREERPAGGSNGPADAIRRDRARSKILRIRPFGLIAMGGDRQRIAVA